MPEENLDEVHQLHEAPYVMPESKNPEIRKYQTFAKEQLDWISAKGAELTFSSNGGPANLSFPLETFDKAISSMDETVFRFEQPTFPVVRIRTTCWHNRKGIYRKTAVTLMRRLSSGNNDFLVDAHCIGADDVFSQIINLNDCEDGLYYLKLCNICRDFETNSIEEFDYILKPYTKEVPCQSPPVSP